MPLFGVSIFVRWWFQTIWRDSAFNYFFLHKKTHKDHKFLFYQVHLLTHPQILKLTAEGRIEVEWIGFVILSYRVNKYLWKVHSLFKWIFMVFLFCLLKNYFLFRKVLGRELCKGAKIGKVWGKSYTRFQWRPWENI